MDYLPRIADAALDEALASSPIVMVAGARATGKTTSCARRATSQLRLPRDLPLLLSDPATVLRTLSPPALIDEWQLAGTDVLWALKEVVDDDPSPGAFILTGSVEPEAYGPTYPLTGRAATVTWRPMSRRERLGNGDGPAWLEQLRDGSLFVPHNGEASANLDLLTQSGFPGSLRATNAVPQLLAYADSIAQRGGDERRDPVGIGRAMRVLAELDGQAVPMERIWRAADLNRLTLARYYALLERTHVIEPAPAWQTNRLKRLTARPKQFYADTALALAISGLTADHLTSDPTIAGGFLESFVACQLRPEVDRFRGSLHHLRDTAGKHEVDIVIELGGRVVAIEVKATTRPTPAHAAHLEWLRAHLGATIEATVVLHRGTATWELVPGVWAVPISTLWNGRSPRR